MHGLSRREWLTIAGMAGVILFLNILGWGVLTVFVASQIGLGVTAFTLGMRHAFDVDHIAAIDNTTRKLIAEGRRPLSVGFWFSLGHSTVVFGLCLMLSLGVRTLTGQIEADSSGLHRVAGLIGSSVSGVFLCLIGLVNLVMLVGIVKIFRAMRSGGFDEAELEARLDSRGFLNRLLGRVAGAVRRPWHTYPLGLLFGLGFDTATEIGLLVLAGGAAASALPWYAILVLPLLFAAGMTLFDAADGCFMNFAYGWALARPVRKIFYNLTVTALSVLVALVIGLVELVSVLAVELHVRSGPLAVVANLDLNQLGFVLVGLFVVTFVIAVLVWRFGGIEEKYSSALDTPPA
ncbi:MAG TPA: HoxN/HupN/NixA family nickel/cobalt transporter [Amycolatopsis sp.]|jgi:high-affinity nickel-transport protein|nr:HoxN/HupN/NixA family nickel/cobalt transporter [Amycolatopsis sp.]